MAGRPRRLHHLRTLRSGRAPPSGDAVASVRILLRQSRSSLGAGVLRGVVGGGVPAQRRPVRRCVRDWRLPDVIAEDVAAMARRCSVARFGEEAIEGLDIDAVGRRDQPEELAGLGNNRGAARCAAPAVFASSYEWPPRAADACDRCRHAKILARAEIPPNQPLGLARIRDRHVMEIGEEAGKDQRARGLVVIFDYICRERPDFAPWRYFPDRLRQRPRSPGDAPRASAAALRASPVVPSGTMRARRP